MRRLVLTLVALAACVPADEAIQLGATQFTLGATPFTIAGVPANATADAYAIQFDRIVLGFKTMTIGKVGAANTCSYRGTAQRADVVYDPRRGPIQAFNGIQPVVCPDVGIIFGSPDGATTLGDGVPSSDLVDLAIDAPAHAIIDARTTSPSGETWTVHLRFDTARTASRFGGCHVADSHGVTILANQRDEAPVLFGAENLFREFLADDTAEIRGLAFAVADRNRDHVTTMAEMDATPLTDLGDDEAYQLADGTHAGSFGDYLRQLFRFTIYFRNMQGQCTGNDPAVPE
jgi:hypothetical protein